MARKPKLKTTVPDDLLEGLVFNLGGGTYQDAYEIQLFCNLFKIDPIAVFTKLMERCPRFSEAEH